MSTSEPLVKKAKTDDTALTLTDEVEDSPRKGDILKEANEALQESNRLHVRPIVDEKKLGIELFVGNRKDEFHGLIKTRYADFIVHEVDRDGNVSYLTNLDAPEDTTSTKTVELNDILDSKSLECLAEVNSGYLNRHMIDVSDMDKNARTSLHHAIRATFDRLESCTLTESEIAKQDKKDEDSAGKRADKDSETDQQVSSEDIQVQPSSDSAETTEVETKVEPVEEKRYIVVTRRNKISRPRSVWPRDRPDHTYFVLYKENKDTMDAVHNLAAAINTRPSNFSFAGTKDRRAVTTQWLSSWRLEPRKLIAACRRFNKRPFIKVGNFCFKKEPIRLGQLKSNKFDIVIRHLVYNHEGVKVVEKAMKSIKDNGFVNYFGLQRFGTRTIQTHEIGLAILQEKWDKAIDLILSYRFDDNMHPPMSQDDANKESTTDGGDNESNMNYETNPKNDRHKQDGKRWSNGAEQHNSFIDMWKAKMDAEVVFKKYPHYRFSNEGLIMKSLSKSDDANKNHLNALTSLPRTTRSMYVHSYQSLIWNKIVTFRLKALGFEVAPGDLILTSDSNVSDNSLEVLLTTDEVDLIEDPPARNNDDTIPSKQDGVKKTNIEDIESKIVLATEENCKDFTIFDVVLPIVGSRVRLPTNSVGQEIERLLKEDGLSLESFKTHEKLFISYGSYRKILVKPDNVSWSLKQYSHPHQNLVETDLDRLNREMATKGKILEDKPNSPPKSDSNDEALVVELELPPSTYATMCLREIMKKPSTDFNSRF